MLDEFERVVEEFSLSMPGRPEIRAGHLVECPTRFPVASVWYMAEAQHVYDGGGLTTRLRLTAANGRGVMCGGVVKHALGREDYCF